MTRSFILARASLLIIILTLITVMVVTTVLFLERPADTPIRKQLGLDLITSIPILGGLTCLPMGWMIYQSRLRALWIFVVLQLFIANGMLLNLIIPSLFLVLAYTVLKQLPLRP